MTDEHRCVVCPQLRPDHEPRMYDRRQVCDGCRARLRGLLGEVRENYAGLSLAKGSTSGSKVSGSRTPPLPLAVGALDLTMPAGRDRAVQSDLVPLYETVQVKVPVYERPIRPDVDEYRMVDEVRSQRRRRRDERGWLAYGLSGDQVGDASVVGILDSWARDWQTYRWATLPEPTVPRLVDWLLDRLDWACDEHPAIDDFAWELAQVAAAIRPAGPRPDLKKGIPCRGCDRVALYHWPGSDRIECGACPALLTFEEYDRWVSLNASKEHRTWVAETVAPQRAWEDVMTTRPDELMARLAGEFRRHEEPTGDRDAALIAWTVRRLANVNDPIGTEVFDEVAREREESPVLGKARRT